MPNKPYTNNEKMLIATFAKLVKTRSDMMQLAPLLARHLGRTQCAICKQIELALGIHWQKQF